MAFTQNVADGYFSATYAIPQAPYVFRLEARHCEGSVYAAVLNGHSRVVSIALRTRPLNAFEDLVWLPENAVAGTLPVRPRVGWIVAGDGTARVLDFQDGAYYIGGVQPAKYTLRFEVDDTVQVEVPLDASHILDSQLLRQDVTAATFRRDIECVPIGKSNNLCY